MSEKINEYQEILEMWEDTINWEVENPFNEKSTK